MHNLSVFDIQNYQHTALVSFLIYRSVIFHIPWDFFNYYEGIFMQVLFRGKTLCSDQPKSDKTSHF